MPPSNWTLRRTLTVVGACLALSALGCATLLSDTDEEVSIESEPEEATIYVNGEKRGSTPTRVILPVDSSHEIRIEKEGYEPRTFYIDNEIGLEWAILDVVFGVVPVLVDAVTGAWYKLEKNHIRVTLQKSEGDSDAEGELVIHGATRIGGSLGPFGRVGAAPFGPVDPR